MLLCPRMMLVLSFFVGAGAVFCSQCGHGPALHGARFCIRCGAALVVCALSSTLTIVGREFEFEFEFEFGL